MSGSLSLVGVSAAYGTAPVLDEVRVEGIAAGTVTALIGPNAAGKSTLLKAVAGIVRAQGEIRLGAERLDALGLSARARHVRYVPQVYATQARLSVFELLLVARMCGGHGRPRADDVHAVESAIATVGIGHLASRFAGALSGGQQQLVALAQALTRPAPVLLLDEPTSALDLRNQLEALAIIRRVARVEQAIVVVAIHDLNLAARHTDRVVLMSRGRVVGDGTPDAVLTTAHCAPVYGVALAHGETSRGSRVIDAYLPG